MVEEIKKVNLLTDVPQEEIRWGSVKLSEIVNKEYRIDASTFEIEGKHAREILNKCKWKVVNLTGVDGLATAYHRPRFKRIWVEKSNLPIYQPAQINELDPSPSGYLSDKTSTDIDSLRVKPGQILLTCSGTIGNTTIVSKTLSNRIFSHDLIRIDVNESKMVGYIYAYLNTKIGKVLINTNNYGAVISHIEPHHLDQLPIPLANEDIINEISNLINKSFELRDQANENLKQAKELFKESLNLPEIEDFDKATENDVRVNYVKLSELNNRFEGSYHLKLINQLLKHFNENSKEVLHLGSDELSTNVYLAGRFKRVYVEEGQGTVFFGGKQLLELNPSTKKYLSTIHHGERLKNELLIKQNTILISCSGTIGKVTLAPKHWEGWAINQHVARVECGDLSKVGYLTTYLSTEYGKAMIERYTYGAVVDEIDARHIRSIPVPILHDETIIEKINSLTLLANDLKYEAYKLEQSAITMFNAEVIHKQKD